MTGEPEAVRRLTEERIRLAGRDPRLDPQPGDVVETGRWWPSDHPAVRIVTGIDPGGTALVRGMIVRWRDRDGPTHGYVHISRWKEWARDGVVYTITGQAP